MRIEKQKCLSLSVIAVFSVLFMMTLSSCDDGYTYFYEENNPPVSNFTTEVAEYLVEIENTSSSATSYFWDFGDGTTSEEFAPEAHLYAGDGVYDITLTVTDNNGLDSVSVNSVSLPYMSFGHTVDFGTVTFENRDANATSYYWDFGDGTSSTEEDPIHNYEIGGTYYVTQIAKTSSSENSYFESVVTGDAAFISPTFEGEKSDWGGNFSTSGAPTPPAGNGAKLDSESKFLSQTIRVYSNVKYRITFSTAIDSNGTLKSAPFTITDDDPNSANYGTKLIDINVNEYENDDENAYVELSFDFNTGSAEYINVRADYGDVTIRYSNFSITPLN